MSAEQVALFFLFIFGGVFAALFVWWGYCMCSRIYHRIRNS